MSLSPLAKEVATEVINAMTPLFEEFRTRVVKNEHGMHTLWSKADQLVEAGNRLDIRTTKLEATTERLETRIINLEVKTDKLTEAVNRLDTRVSKLEATTDRLETKVNILGFEVSRIGVLLEHMDRKIDVALDVSKMVTRHEVSFQGHEKRLKTVEMKVLVLHKSARRPKT